MVEKKHNPVVAWLSYEALNKLKAFIPELEKIPKFKRILKEGIAKIYGLDSDPLSQKKKNDFLLWIQETKLKAKNLIDEI